MVLHQREAQELLVSASQAARDGRSGEALLGLAKIAQRFPFDARVMADAHGHGELRIVSGAGHDLRHDPRAVAILLGWLDRQRHRDSGREQPPASSGPEARPV